MPKKTDRFRLCLLADCGVHCKGNKMVSTVKFNVGKEDNQKSYTVDREALIRQSLFFRIKFCGPNADPTAEINLFEEDPEAFDIFIRYIETGQIQSQSPKDVINCFYLFKRYLMPDAQSKCRDYLLYYISSDTVGKILEIAHATLRTSVGCWQHIFMNTEEIFESVNFRNFDKNIVSAIVCQDIMSRWLDEDKTEKGPVREITVYKSIVEWGKEESNRKARNGKYSDLRKIVEPLLSHVRFLLMTNKEFEEVVCKDGILTGQEQLEISKAIELGATSTVLPFLNFSKEGRKPFDETLCFMPCCKNEEYNAACMMTLRFRPRSHSVFVYGIVLHDVHPKKNNYIITLKDVTKNITCREKISQETEPESPYLLFNSPPIYIEKRENCTIILQTDDPISCCLKDCDTHPLLEKLSSETFSRFTRDSHFLGILALPIKMYE